jgi:hypothetical protein
MPHLIKFVDDPASPQPTEFGFLFACSLDEALEKVTASLPGLKAKHGAVGYRIEDVTGRTVWIGPGRYDDA